MLKYSMTQTIKPVQSYALLLKEVRIEIAQGLSRAQAAYDEEKIMAYWKIGESITLHLLNSNNRADYGKQLFSKLSEDLNIGQRLLYQMSQFYNAYPHFKHTKNLKWSHYRLLTSVKDKKERQKLETEISTSCLSQRDLESAIKVNPSTKNRTTHAKKLIKPKCSLYTYKISKGNYTDNLLIDCGFNIYRETEDKSFNKGIIESFKDKDNYSFLESSTLPKHLYTYKAHIERIVDGDTLVLNIDCGFRLWTKQIVRLRKIDTPPLKTAKGQQAKQFLIKALKGVPFVVIKSHNKDNHGRYLVDLFYSIDETKPKTIFDKGTFLNQELLDQNLAERFF